MPPKISILAKLRKQSATRGRSTQAAPGSAFEQLRRQAEERRTGFKRSYEEADGETDNVTRFKYLAARKSVSKPKKKPTARKKTVLPRETPPAIESWRRAGGDETNERAKPKALTNTLGFARVATWRVTAFCEAVEKLLEEHGGCEEVMTEEIVHGGESVTDVLIRFRSEMVAEVMQEKLDGQMLQGRQLQVDFA